MQARTVGMAASAPEHKVLVSVEEAATMLSLGRTSVYMLVRRNELQSTKIGRTRRVLVSSLYDYVSRLVTEPN
jgi:excisionase family DNA binding protein